MFDWWRRRRQERVRRRAQASQPDPDNYWRSPESFAAKGLTPAYWNDPWPELQGMLTSEHIKAYNDVVGQMIRPFDPGRLRTASYELTLGPRYLVENEEGLLTPEAPRLRLPPNSLSFVSMEQVLCLPHYVVGRFDLAIDFIYQGLLLGTGPQVDPGFQGGLSCPLHNISNQEIVIELGQAFAKIDFAKTVPRPAPVRSAWEDIETEEQLRRWLEDEPAHSPSRLFKNGSPDPWRKPIFDYLGNKRPTSSVREIQADVRRLRNVGWGAIAGLVVTLLIAIPALILQGTDLVTGDLAQKSAVEDVKHGAQDATKALTARTQALEAQVAGLKLQVRRLQRGR